MKRSKMNLRTNPVPIIPIIALIATLTVALIALAVIAAGQYAAKENIKLTFPTGWIRICTRPVEWLELSDLTFARILEEGTIELDQPTKDHIAAIREFYSNWLAAVDRSTLSYSVNDASWHKLLQTIEINTNAFLAERQIDALDDLWLDRREVR